MHGYFLIPAGGGGGGGERVDDLSQPLVLGGKNKIIDPKGLMSITSSSKKNIFA